MKLHTKQFIKDLEGKDTELTIGKALATILIQSKGDTVKLFTLAQKANNDETLELDAADLETVKNAVKTTENTFNALVTGQLLIELSKESK